MNKRKFGKTGIEIPEMGMGCWAIGGTGYGPVSEEDALIALESAWEGGVRFFDTADTYGEGRSEKLIGQFLKLKPRHEVILASKGGVDFYHGGHKKNFDPEYLSFACNESLKRLDVDTIDVYQLHNPKLEILKRGDAWNAVMNLKQSGKIRFAGISLHTVEEVLWALENLPVDSIQLIYNLFDQRMRFKVFPVAQKKQVALIVREPLACGLLTGKYNADEAFPKDDHRRRYSKEKLLADTEKLEKISNLLASRFTLHADRPSLAQAALEFVLAHDAVSCVIPGAKNPAQIQSNLQAVEQPCLTSDVVRQLHQLFEHDELFTKYLLPS